MTVRSSLPIAVEMRRKSREPLIVGQRHMTCPRCRKAQDILSYMQLGMVEEFKSETMPIYKCPSCRWVFAPAEEVPEVEID